MLLTMGDVKPFEKGVPPAPHFDIVDSTTDVPQLLGRCRKWCCPPMSATHPGALPTRNINRLASQDDQLKYIGCVHTSPRTTFLGC